VDLVLEEVVLQVAIKADIEVLVCGPPCHGVGEV